MSKKVRNAQCSKDLVISLTRLESKTRPKFPVILSKNKVVPTTKTESLNNFNEGFASVSISPRQSEYSDKYHSNSGKGAMLMSTLMSKIGTKGWGKSVGEFEIKSEEIESIIEGLKRTSSGPDEINFDFIKNVPQWCSLLVEKILNSILSGGGWPQAWLEADITPISKDPRGDNSKFSNYRPISVTPLLSRVCERVIVSKLLSEVENLNLLNDYQFGARKGRGTQDALAHVHGQILLELQRSGECNAVFLDISKAFDRVDHTLLLQKLHMLGISDLLVWIIGTFLLGRKQRVKVGGCFSDWTNVVCGVPQGTCLGPILFLLFVNDCPLGDKSDHDLKINTKKAINGTFFVDDIIIWGTGKRNHQVTYINKVLDNILGWANDWGVDFNIKKTKHVCFGKKIDQAPKISMGGGYLETVEIYKYLGLTFHYTLSFNIHITEYVLPRLRKEIGFLKKIVSKSPLSAKSNFIRIFWVTKLRPVIEYAASTWMGNISQKNLDDIDNLQINFFRSSLGLPPFTRGEDILMDCAVHLQSLRLLGIRMKFFFRVVSGRSPLIVQDTLKALQNGPSCIQGTKCFVGETKKVVVAKRLRWAINNTDNIIIPKKDSQKIFLQKIQEPIVSAKYGYWRLYPNTAKANQNKWKCVLPIIKNRSSEGIYCHSYLRDSILETICKRGICDSISKGDCFMREVRLAIVKWVEKLQIQSFLKGRGVYVALRKQKWFWDPILYSIANPQMRLLRKLRFGVSELADHSFFLNNGNRICCNCTLQSEENLEHYFLNCPKYLKIRQEMKQELKSIWGDQVDITTKLILGFFKKIESRSFRKSTSNQRKRSYLCVCDYIFKSTRFSFN